MGLFGGDSSTSNLYTTNNIKKDQVIGNGSNGFAADNGSTVNVSMLDGGAISQAFGFGSNALGFADSVASNSLGFAGTAFKDLIASQQNSLAGILSGVQSTQNFILATQAQASGQMDSRTKLFIGLGLLVVVGVIAWRR